MLLLWLLCLTQIKWAQFPIRDTEELKNNNKTHTQNLYYLVAYIYLSILFSGIYLSIFTIQWHISIFTIQWHISIFTIQWHISIFTIQWHLSIYLSIYLYIHTYMWVFCSGTMNASSSRLRRYVDWSVRTSAACTSQEWMCCWLQPRWVTHQHTAGSRLRTVVHALSNKMCSLSLWTWQVGGR